LSENTFPEYLDARIKKIKAALFDVDGVMTDGGIIFDSNGYEVKKFNTQDGLGIFLAREAGLLTGIITGRSSEVVERRAQELNVHFLSMGKKNKLNPYNEYKRQFNLADEEVAFIGDDLLDLPIMLHCGFAVCVYNGVDYVKERAHYVTKASGGMGAVREVIELILKCQGKWELFLDSYFNKLIKSDK